MAAAQYNTTTVANTPTVILPANNERRGVIIYNNGASTMYVGFDTNVSLATGMPILPQSNFTLNGDKCWRGAIYGIATTGTDDCRFWEWLQ